MGDVRRPRMPEDMFGYGYGEPTDPPSGGGDSALLREMMADYARAKARGVSQGPSVGPNLRDEHDPKSKFACFPTTAILFDPKLFPGLPTRLRVMRQSSATSTAVVAQKVFPQRTTIYGISARVHVTNLDPAVNLWSNDEIDGQFTRLNGDALSDDVAPVSAIAGTGESMMPIGGHGWSLEKNDGVIFTGTASYQTWWLWVVFHCVDQVPWTNLGSPS
uniref:Uncharacterized protein n=1 Tax=viral metagenome TaxID=1070528 RepID=A0A6M3L5W3_9ZZZZ